MGDFYNKHTIYDLFEDFLLTESGVFKTETPSLRFLRESQGIIDNYYTIIDEIYGELIKVKGMPYDSNISYLIYRLRNYEIKTECFIKTVNINVLAGKKGLNYHGSYFINDYDNAKISKDLKLDDVKITIGITNDDLRTNESKNEFFMGMAHELHHAFRFYNICISNNSYIANEKEISSKYGNLIKLMAFGNSSDDDYKMAYSLYNISKNEIISESNRLYEFIRQNEKITRDNFVNYLKDFPLYDKLVSVQKYLSYIDDIIYNKQDKNKEIELGLIYIKLAELGDINPESAFVKLKFKVSSMYEYIRRIFMRTINKAFDDFGRKNKIYDIDVKQIIERDKHFSQLKEILNKC